MALSDFARRVMGRLIAISILAMSVTGSLAARENLHRKLTEEEFVKRAADAAMADAIAASETPPTAAELEARQRADELIIQDAMRQLAGSTVGPPVEQLPQPEIVDDADIVATLGYPIAWKNPSQENQKDEGYKRDVVELLHYAAWVYFEEWSCDTGGEVAIAHQIIDLLPRLVTSYPERLMLRSMIQERDLRGYPKWKSCDRGELVDHQSLYQQKLRVVLERL